ncbi:MAG TPA: hypothetical protein ENH59_08085 [Bacteroidetes bacterium]|nr:hypothetical protein [Bacteroidota bacterium]
MHPGNKGYLMRLLPFCLSAFILAGCGTQKEEIEYTTGVWDEDSLGYHRVVIENKSRADAVYVDVPWRRRDNEPWNKAVILTGSDPEKVIDNIICLSSDNEKGRFIFQPVYGPGKYYLYYLPAKMKGRSNYPTVTYPPPRQTADNAWIELHNLNDSAHVRSLPVAQATVIQSRNKFNSFFPMEITASEEEVNRLLGKYPAKTFLLFPEERSHPIRMKEYLPLRWIEEGPFGPVEGEARRGEFFTFQVGLYCIGEDIDNLEILFSDLKTGRKKTVIHHDSISSFNTSGIDWDGKIIAKKLSIPKNRIQPMWFGFMIPENTKARKISGHMVIKAGGHEAETLKINIKILKDTIANHGDDNPYLMSRMRWLDSRLALDNEVTDPFIPVEKENRSLKILGRQIDIGTNGLPSRYLTYFNSSNTAIRDNPENVLASPVTFDIYRANGSKIFFVSEEPAFEKDGSGKYNWETKNVSSSLEMKTEGSLEFDGFAQIRISVMATEDIDLSDIRLSMHVRKKFAPYFMGLGLRGGQRPYYISWKWDRMKHQEGAWIGDVNGGLQFSLRDDNYERPLNTNFYREKPLIMPEAWFNKGKGGINISSGEHATDIYCYSGSRSLKTGDELVFTVNFLFTPFKLIATDKQWRTRFYHRYKDLDSIKNYGANVVNVHHATEINPWINYPFLEQEKMKNYIDKAHSMGMRVKIYNTIRELSNRAPELFAIRSLGHEIFSPGPGGGFNWLQEHLADDYIPAWFVPDNRDAAIINSGMSRWHNYYIEGVNWLAENMGIDGLYLDDIAFDRTTMKRLRKVLDRNRDSALIDLHSANQYNVRDGYTNSANLYMEHFPYVDRLWFGEYFDPDLPPDFWLIEMSGIPFGLMGEMLQDGGNQYKGLVYGMTSRAPWSGDPRNIWDVFDEFGMTGSEFIGYWSEDCPVTTGYRNAPATVYLKDNKVMIAIASWYDENKELWLNIDWSKIGMNRNESVLRAPYIRNFQAEKIYSPWERIPLEAGKGVVLIIED